MSGQERRFPALATLRVFPKETGLPANFVEFSARERTFISVTLALHSDQSRPPLVLLQAIDVAGIPAHDAYVPKGHVVEKDNKEQNAQALLEHLRQQSQNPEALMFSTPKTLRAAGYISNDWPGLPDTLLISMPPSEFQAAFNPESALFPFHLSPEFALAQLRSLALDQAIESLAVGAESNPLSVLAPTYPTQFDSSRIAIHSMLEAGYKETERFWMYYLSLVLRAEARQRAHAQYPDTEAYWRQNGIWEDWVS